MIKNISSLCWDIETDHLTNEPEFIRLHIDGDGYDIADLSCDETGNKHANAKLIACAPALLFALREAVEIIESTGLDASTAKAAIARATGGE